MVRFRGKHFKELLALSVFSLLAGICISLIFKNSFIVVKEYAQAFSFQINNLQPDKNKIIISVLGNRIAILTIVYVCSYFFKGRYFTYILSCLFFFLYGVYFLLNCLALGIKGILTGFVFFVPQWLFYILAYGICIYYNTKRGKNSPLIKITKICIPFLLIMIGSIIETYVTLPMLMKIF